MRHCPRCGLRPRKPRPQPGQFRGYCAPCEAERQRLMRSSPTCECGAPKGEYAITCVACRVLPRELRLLDVLWSTREGRSAAVIAADLGLSERQVVRIRGRLREEGRL
jgi:hypothetical protein